MTLYSLALRINEIIELHKEYDQTRNAQLLTRAKDMRADLDLLVKSIISTYQVTIKEDPKDQYVDVDQYGS